MSDDLEAGLHAAGGLEEKKRLLNEFKNRETYFIDLDHIVDPDRDFAFLSGRLTDLAELIVVSAVEIAYADLEKKYGRPIGFAGLPAAYAVFGLGKLGGYALGYASDIELLFVYSGGSPAIIFSMSSALNPCSGRSGNRINLFIGRERSENTPGGILG